MALIKKILAFLRAHGPVLATICGLVIIFCRVPQLQTLFPTRSELHDGDLPVGFILFTCALVLVYVTSLLWVLAVKFTKPTYDGRRIGRRICQRMRRAKTVIATPSNPVPTADEPQRKLTSSFTRAALFASLSITAALIGYLEPKQIQSVTKGDTAICYGVAGMLLLWSGYSVLRGVLPFPVVRYLFRSLASVTVLAVIGEISWWAGLHCPIVSPRIYSIGVICYLCYALLLTVSFLNRIDMTYLWLPVWPVTFLLVAILSITIPLSPPEVGTHNVSSYVNEPDATTLNWLEAFKRRLDQSESTHPLIFVAASGGGSRAALFTALILDELRRFEGRETVHSGTPDDEQPFRARQQIALISSVSGGSLAAACYTDMDYRRTRIDKTAAPKNYDFATIARMMAEEAKRLNGNEKFVELHASAWRSVYEKCLSAAKIVDQDGAGSGSHDVLERQYIDDMCYDYMAPLLRGVLLPGMERGESVTLFWRNQLGLESTTADGYSEQVPLWFCNATEVGGGQPFVIGFPPLPPDMVGRNNVNSITLNGDIRGWHLSRAEAVRVSANFPWGFELARSPMKLQRYRAGGDNYLEDMYIIDGGVFDNSGIAAIRSVLEMMQLYSFEERAITSSETRKRIVKLSQEILDEFDRRGVILIEINSGAKPEAPSALVDLLACTTTPINALNNAAYHNSQRSANDNLNTMRTVIRDDKVIRLRERIAALCSLTGESELERNIRRLPSIDNFYHLTVTCNEQDNVMTAWALPPSDKAKIVVRYLVAAEELKQSLNRIVHAHLHVQSLIAQLESRVLDLEDAVHNNSEFNCIQVVNVADVYARLSSFVATFNLENAGKRTIEQLLARNAPDDEYLATSIAIDRAIQGIQNQLWTDNAVYTAGPVSLPSTSFPSETTTKLHRDPGRPSAARTTRSYDEEGEILQDIRYQLEDLPSAL